jgi:hypothetical protein
LDSDGLFPDIPQTKQKPGAALEAKQKIWFEEWWAGYWRKRDRKKAWDAFRKQVRNEARFRQVMEASREQSPEMLTRAPKHRPYGSTWLNGERWDDEADAEPCSTPQDDYPELRAW